MTHRLFRMYFTNRELEELAMNNVYAHRVADYSSCKNPGDFFICDPDPNEGMTRRLSFLCPCGCGDLCGIKVRNDGKNVDGAWGWNGNEDKPTTTPSIAINGNHWHGYLTDGVFRSC